MPISSLTSNPCVGLCTEHGPVPLEHVEVRAEIRGPHARVMCIQRYCNTLERQASANKIEWEMLAAKATRWLDGAAVVPLDRTSWLEWARGHLNAEYS